MRRLILGTAGHIDHGKTALVRALTGVDTDRLPDEKRRGITIDLGFARLPLADGMELGVVDVPGHEGFIRNMLAGATGIDLVLLVVAADEGVMPQTREHLAIVELLGVRAGVVAVTKTDLVEPDWLELVLDDLRSELDGTAFGDAPILPVSSETGEGVDAVRDALARAAGAVEERGADDLFRLPVDRVFTVRGTGTVVTGTVWSGSIERDATVRLLPGGVEGRVRGIQVHGRDVEAARAGQRAAIALAGVERDAVARGDVAVCDEVWTPHRMVTARLQVLETTDWTIRRRQRVRFHLGTAEVMGRVVPFGTDELLPGDSAWAQFRLEAPVVARAGDRFVVRSYSPMTTIGGGRVVEPVAPKRKRLDDETAARLEAQLGASVEASITARAEAAGWRGVAVERLAVDCPASPTAVRAAVSRLAGSTVVAVGGRLFGGRVAREARERILSAVDRFHAEHPLRPGMDWEEARRALPEYAAPELGQWVLDGLVDQGILEGRDGQVARRGFTPQPSPDQRQVLDALLRLHEEAGLTPPCVKELPAELRERNDLRPLLKLLEYRGELVALTADRFISRTALDGAAVAVRRELGGRNDLSPADFKTVLSVSRKHLIPLLECLDRMEVTVRRGETRVVRSAAPSA